MAEDFGKIIIELGDTKKGLGVGSI